MVYLARANGTVIAKFAKHDLHARLASGDVSPSDRYLSGGAQEGKLSKELSEGSVSSLASTAGRSANVSTNVSIAGNVEIDAVSERPTKGEVQSIVPPGFFLSLPTLAPSRAFRSCFHRDLRTIQSAVRSRARSRNAPLTRDRSPASWINRSEKSESSHEAEGVKVT